MYPQEIIFSAKQGLLLWYNSVLPSIFPFLVTSCVLIEIGAVNVLGRILEPIMRPVFNVPGHGAFPLLLGCLSGYPVGAKIVADLREKDELTKAEAQRLIGFSNNAGPLFVIGAVGTSLLGSPWAGYFILITNYIAVFLVGLVFRFYKIKDGKSEKAKSTGLKMIAAKPLGKILTDSVKSSIEIVLSVGGFVLLFSVLINILNISGITTIISKPLMLPFAALGIEDTLQMPFMSGLFEITNGIKLIGAQNAQYHNKILLSGFLAAFGGLSIFAQTISIISKTDISVKIYLFAKILQAVLQATAAAILYPFFADKIVDKITVMKPLSGNLVNNTIFSINCLIIALLVCITSVCILAKKTKQ